MCCLEHQRTFYPRPEDEPGQRGWKCPGPWRPWAGAVNQAGNCLASEFPVSWRDVYAFCSSRFEIGFVLVLVKSLVADLKVKVAQSCPTLCNPMDYTVHGILQARVLEWVAFPFSRGSSQPRSPAMQADSLPAEPQGKPCNWSRPELIKCQGQCGLRAVVWETDWRGSRR